VNPLIWTVNSEMWEAGHMVPFIRPSVVINGRLIDVRRECEIFTHGIRGMKLDMDVVLSTGAVPSMRVLSVPRCMGGFGTWTKMAIGPTCSEYEDVMRRAWKCRAKEGKRKWLPEETSGRGVEGNREWRVREFGKSWTDWKERDEVESEPSVRELLEDDLELTDLISDWQEKEDLGLRMVEVEYRELHREIHPIHASKNITPGFRILDDGTFAEVVWPVGEWEGVRIRTMKSIGPGEERRCGCSRLNCIYRPELPAKFIGEEREEAEIIVPEEAIEYNLARPAGWVSQGRTEVYDGLFDLLDRREAVPVWEERQAKEWPSWTVECASPRLEPASSETGYIDRDGGWISLTS